MGSANSTPTFQEDSVENMYHSSHSPMTIVVTYPILTQVRLGNVEGREWAGDSYILFGKHYTLSQS